MAAQSRYAVGIIILSDRVSSGEESDGCLPVFSDLLEESEFEIAETIISSDEPAAIRHALETMIANECPLIFTCGGTGCSPRDYTPEVTAEFIKRPTPGIDEAIRRFSVTKSDFAIYSRAISGIADRSLVINLPGSPKAVKEILGFLLPTLSHPLDLIGGTATDCQIRSDGKPT